MKKTKLLTLAAAGMFALAACTDDGETGLPVPPPDPETNDMDLTLTYEAPDNGFGKLAPAAWTKEAVAGIFAEGTVNSPFTVKSGDGTASTVFTGKAAGIPKTCCAYSPYAETAVMADGKLGVNVPNVQQYVPGGIADEYFVRVGRSGADGSIRMLDIMGALAVRIKPAFDLTVKEIVFKTAAGQFAAGRLDTDMDYPDGDIQAPEVMGNRTGTLALALPEEGVTVSAGEAADFYLMLPPAEYAGCTVTVKALDEEDKVLTAEEPITVRRAELAVVEVAYEPKQEPRPDGTDLNDPARYGLGGQEPVYSNCYIVDNAGSYYMSARVIGNGPSGLPSEGGFHTASAYITPASAALVWEDAEGLLSDVRLSAEGGYVCFTAAAGPGNALVAVYDGADGSGNILWSWHIWVGEMPKDQQYKTPGGADSFVVMDRNLGARFCPDGNDAIAAMTDQQKYDSYGLFYQWGRKDPLPGGAALTGLKEAPMYGQVTEVGKVSYNETGDEANNNLLYAVRNPATFIKMNPQTSDWTYTTNNRLWGNPEGYGDGTAYPKGVKTIYDPCPPGYMTPPANLWAATDFESTYVGKFNCGWAFTYDGTNQTWYPGAGVRWEDDGTVGDVGRGGSYWSNAPASADAKTALGLVCYMRVADIVNADEYNRASGINVRCVRE